MKTFLVHLICILGLIVLSSCMQPLPVLVEEPDNNPPPSISQPEATPTEAIPTEEPDFLATPTIHGVENPTGVIPAGMPAIVDGYVLIAEKSGMQVDGDFVSFELNLRIIGNEAKLFRYNVYSIRLKDDLGNYYDYYYSNSSYSDCAESSIYNPKQYMINPEEDVEISSDNPGYMGYNRWCDDGNDRTIPGFRAMVPASATSLILEFEAFGPFSGFGIEFDL